MSNGHPLPSPGAVLSDILQTLQHLESRMDDQDCRLSTIKMSVCCDSPFAPDSSRSLRSVTGVIRPLSPYASTSPISWNPRDKALPEVPETEAPHPISARLSARSNSDPTWRGRRFDFIDDDGKGKRMASDYQRSPPSHQDWHLTQSAVASYGSVTNAATYSQKEGSNGSEEPYDDAASVSVYSTQENPAPSSPAVARLGQFVRLSSLGQFPPAVNSTTPNPKPVPIPTSGQLLQTANIANGHRQQSNDSPIRIAYSDVVSLNSPDIATTSSAETTSTRSIASTRATSVSSGGRPFDGAAKRGKSHERVAMAYDAYDTWKEGINSRSLFGSSKEKKMEVSRLAELVHVEFANPGDERRDVSGNGVDGGDGERGGTAVWKLTKIWGDMGVFVRGHWGSVSTGWVVY